jgi:hypothetical protein
MEILTNKTVSLNHSDIILFEKTNKIIYIIDISIPNFGDMQTDCNGKNEKIYRIKQ